MSLGQTHTQMQTHTHRFTHLLPSNKNALLIEWWQGSERDGRVGDTDSSSHRKRESQVSQAHIDVMFGGLQT